MSLEAIIAGIVAILGAIAALVFKSRSDGRKQEQLKWEIAKAQADAARRSYIEKVRKDAQAANPRTPADAVTSHGMSDAEFKQVFGYDRPDGNS